MSSAKQNASIARLIVGAMSIDGELSKDEQAKVAESLEQIGLAELIADVGAALDLDHGDINPFTECASLLESLGELRDEVSPLVFRLVCDVVATDRFVSLREAAYLSGIARGLSIPRDLAKEVFKQVMVERRGRLEAAGNKVDGIINPHLKELLSFDGAEKLVGELSSEELSEMIQETRVAIDADQQLTRDDVHQALAVLGLPSNAKMREVEEVWKDTIRNLELPKLAELGETFVTAGLQRVSRIHEAYKTVLNYKKQQAPEK